MIQPSKRLSCSTRVPEKFLPPRPVEGFEGLYYLIDGIPTPLKNMKVSWDDYSHYIMEK